MSRKRTFDDNLQIPLPVNFPDKICLELKAEQKYAKHFDKYSSQVIERSAPIENFQIYNNDTSSSAKLKNSQNAVHIRQTLIYHPASSIKNSRNLNQEQNQSRTSRLNELLNLAIDLKSKTKKSTIQLNRQIYTAPASDVDHYSKNSLSQKTYSTNDCHQFFKYTENTKPIEIFKGLQLDSFHHGSIETLLQKFKQQNHKKKNLVWSQLSDQKPFSFLKYQNSATEAKDNFSKKKYFQNYPKKIEKQSCSEIKSSSTSAFSPPHKNYEKSTYFELKCYSANFSSHQSPSLKFNDSNIVVKLFDQKIKIEDFTICRKLGQGRFGTVYLAYHKSTGTLFAIKIIQKKTIKANNLIQQFILQVKLQSYLNHPFILKIYAIFDNDQQIYLIMQYMQQGSLFDYFKSTKNKKLTEIATAEKVRYLAQSIKYLQDCRIVHRDIKPQNVIMTYGVCKLADFGWATFFDQQRRKTYCGTCDYVAPQILQGRFYDETVDLWCIGVLTYQLVVGKAPFYHISQKHTREKIMNVDLVYQEEFSNNLKSFLGGLIQKDPEERMSIEEVLNHPFIKSIKLSD